MDLSGVMTEMAVPGYLSGIVERFDPWHDMLYNAVSHVTIIRGEVDVLFLKVWNPDPD
jgi:hypothetical protein